MLVGCAYVNESAVFPFPPEFIGESFEYLSLFHLKKKFQIIIGTCFYYLTLVIALDTRYINVQICPEQSFHLLFGNSQIAAFLDRPDNEV